MRRLQLRLMHGMLPVILLLSGAIFAITFVGARTAVIELSQQVIAGTLSRTESQLQRFFDPAVQNLRFVRALGEAGLLPIEQPAAINDALKPILDQHPQITSLMVADQRGREHMLLKLGERWSNRQTRVELWGDRSLWVEWSAAEAPREEWRVLGYDPRARPWYRGAREANGAVHWTAPYAFFTTGDPGITASVTFDAGNGDTGTLGFDVRLRDLSRFTLDLGDGTRRQVFVTTEDGRFLGLPAIERFADAQAAAGALLRTAAEIGEPLLLDALAALPRIDSGPVNFTSAGEAWIGASNPFVLGPGARLRVVVLMPLDEVLGELTALRWWIVVLTVIAMAVGAWRTSVEASRVSRPIRAIVRQTERITRGDLSPQEPVRTSIEEVHRLASAQEEMRASLGTLLKMERDLQLARQVQQDTFPTRVPQVRGYALDAWSEPAEETGGDTYDLVATRRAGDGDVLLVDDDGERLHLLLADAVGHGIGPALLVTQVRAMLRMAIRTAAPLEDIVEHLNEQLCDDLSDGRFITMWLAELDVSGHGLKSFSAGQGPLLHYVESEQQVRVVEADAPPLGLIPDLIAEPPATVMLQPGDVFAVISDGVFDAAAPSGEMFGSERVKRIVVEGSGDSPSRLLDRLRGALDAFTDGAPADDDRTAIILKRL